MDFVSLAEPIVKRHGFDHFGWVHLETPLTMDIYRSWLNEGLHAGMGYLKDHAPIKENARLLAPQALSALVVTLPYLPHPFPAATPKGVRTALYAQGEDYHLHFKNRLSKVAQELSVVAPEHEFLCFTDSAPILERDLAYRAGLGWFGKNTCLLHRDRGSLFFIGQILTSLPLAQSASIQTDHCGTCDRCLRACPTGALVSPRKLDANLCISYWTIEAKGTAPEALREKFGDWFFGCDICQTVCPWNEKAFDLSSKEDSSPNREVVVRDLRWILTASNKTLERKFQFSPLSRARPFGLKRNAILVAANAGLHELKPELEVLKSQSRLKELAEWALARLN